MRHVAKRECSASNGLDNVREIDKDDFYMLRGIV